MSNIKENRPLTWKEQQRAIDSLRRRVFVHADKGPGRYEYSSGVYIKDESGRLTRIQNGKRSIK